MKLDPAQRASIDAAIAAAEAKTDGEIMVIVARQSDAYHDVALHWALLSMFLGLALLASFPEHYMSAIDRISGGWQHVWTPRELMTVALVVAAFEFLIVRYILVWPRLRLALTPRSTRTRRVRRRAIELFKAGTERRTATRTGALIYLSLAEHQAEIVADAAIHERVEHECWGAAMAALVDAMRAGRMAEGISTAVAAVGDILAETFPRTGKDPNELPDRLIEL